MSNAIGQKPSAVQVTKNLTQRIEYDGSGNAIYIGLAPVGSLTSAPVWQVQKLTYDGSNRFIYNQFADGDDAFDNIYDDRASLNYS